MSDHTEPITLEFLGRMMVRFSDDAADLKSQFVVQFAILQRLEAGQQSLTTEVRELHHRLDRIDRRLRSLEERLDRVPV